MYTQDFKDDVIHTNEREETWIFKLKSKRELLNWIVMQDSTSVGTGTVGTFQIPVLQVCQHEEREYLRG